MGAKYFDKETDKICNILGTFIFLFVGKQSEYVWSAPTLCSETFKCLFSYV